MPPSVTVEAPPARTAASARVPGLVAAAVLAAAATVLGTFAPVVGAPVIGIVLGVALSGAARRLPILRPGLATAAGLVLQIGVVLIGTQLSLREVARVGLNSLPVMLGTIAVCLLLAWQLGRRMGIGFELRALIGVGTAICGASAIAAVSPAIRARHPAVAYAISTIFLFNVAAVLAFPPLGHALGMGQNAFGLFAGTAVNDTSSVVAAATSYGTEASGYAVVVKLARTLMIIPITLALAALARRRNREQQAARPVLALVPWFLVGFLVAAAANSAGLVPAASHAGLRDVAGFLVTVALCAIGLSTDVAALRRTGPRPVLLGGCLWLAVTATSLLLQVTTV